MPQTLLILAAGKGNRYGGLKQLDPMGPSGETLLDYSVFDALRAGFGKVVFVIRRDFEAEFRRRVGQRYERQIEVSYAFQEMSDLPEGCAVPASRQKPLGTGHAIWCARHEISGPFAAINADDFYGAPALLTLATFLSKAPRQDCPAEFAMVGYRMDRTLSEHGTVSRGLCRMGANGWLESIEEQTGIEKPPGGARQQTANGGIVEFSGNETVSMNCWGFTPALFPLLEAELRRFLSTQGGDAKAEFYIPAAVAQMIAAGTARVSVLPSESRWFGVTYREDKPLVVEQLARLVQAGEYPASLWSGPL